jgi:hypothetical protein
MVFVACREPRREGHRACLAGPQPSNILVAPLQEILMRVNSVMVAGFTATLLTIAPSLSAGAQARGTGAPAHTDIFEATPYVGYMLFGDYLSGPLGSSISNAPAPVVGAQLGMTIAPNLAIVGNLATSSGDIKAGLPFLGGVTIAHSSVVLYDAGLQLSLPVSTMGGTGFSPFLQAGAGAMRYTITESFVTTNATNFAANIGAGADIAVGRGVGIRLMAKDYIGKFDAQQATSFDLSTNTTQNFAFSGGLRLSF